MKIRRGMEWCVRVCVCERGWGAMCAYMQLYMPTCMHACTFVQVSFICA